MGCNCGNKAKVQTTVDAKASTSEPTPISKTLKQSHVYDETDPAYINRVDICTGCEFFNADNQRCMACGCFVKAKARIINASCPLPEPKW